MKKKRRGEVNEMMVRMFISATNANDEARAKSLMRRMNAIEYLVALERLRGGDDAKPLPWFLRKS